MSIKNNNNADDDDEYKDKAKMTREQRRDPQLKEKERRKRPQLSLSDTLDSTPSTTVTDNENPQEGGNSPPRSPRGGLMTPHGVPPSPLGSSKSPGGALHLPSSPGEARTGSKTSNRSSGNQARAGSKEPPAAALPNIRNKDVHDKKDCAKHRRECNDGDLRMATCIEDAYPFDASQKKNVEGHGKGTARNAHFCIEVSCAAPTRLNCDACGQFICDKYTKKINFYWCTNCKRQGRKLELCLACYSTGMLSSGAGREKVDLGAKACPIKKDLKDHHKQRHQEEVKAEARLAAEMKRQGSIESLGSSLSSFSVLQCPASGRPQMQTKSPIASPRPAVSPRPPLGQAPCLQVDNKVEPAHKRNNPLHA
jgi:hypothetical protein